MTFVFVTHDQEEALVMADRIAVMGQGRSCSSVPGSEIYRRAESPLRGGLHWRSKPAGLPMRPGGLAVPAPGGQRLFRTDVVGKGEKATLMVRPEQLLLGAAPARPGSAELSGNLRDLIFVGNGTKRVVNLPSGHEVVAPSSAAIDAGHLRAGPGSYAPLAGRKGAHPQSINSMDAQQ